MINTKAAKVTFRDNLEREAVQLINDWEGPEERVTAYTVANEVGWNPRSAPAKLRSLCTRGFLRSSMVKAKNVNDRVLHYRTTAKGRQALQDG